ncbi:MAG: hypothetical protein JXJ04_18635 [Spirochaetales bacterium]|nr:hypothetical protein [Spirochaetales bacterium]
MKIQFEIMIDDRLARLWKKVFTIKTGVFFIAALLFCTSLFLFSDQITKPYHFKPGDTVSAAEVNDNFNVLYTLINEHDTSISSLQAAGDGFWDGDSSNLTYTGSVGIGVAEPTAKLDVNGKIRGNAVYSYGSCGDGGTTTSDTDVWTGNDLSTSITVQNGDVVKVTLAGNIGVDGATIYMRVNLRTGSASPLMPGNYCFVSGGWCGFTSTALYKATAGGTLTFQGEWHLSNTTTTGYYRYCNIDAFVIGK